jgi:hypothetical protein
MTSALAWPTVATTAIVVLRNQIKLGATELVARLGDIKRLKAAGVDVEFENNVRALAQAAEELQVEEQKSLPSDAKPVVATLPPETAGDRMMKYAELAAIEPRAAILLPFADLETWMRKRFAQLFPQERKSISFLRMVEIFRETGRVPEEAASLLEQLSRLRNRVAHDSKMEITQETALEYLSSIEDVLDYLIQMNFFEERPTPWS